MKFFSNLSSFFEKNSKYQSYLFQDNQCLDLTYIYQINSLGGDEPLN